MLEPLKEQIIAEYFMFKCTLAVLLILSIFGGCSYINKRLGLKDDHIVEEAVEDLIEDHVGVEIDLTPNV
jgi:regulatory protein YycI of two-component signal transduction system YycFG